MKESPSEKFRQMSEEMADALWEGLNEPLPDLDPGELERAIENARKLYQERRSHKGDMRIYDYADDSLEVDLQKKPVLEIQVSVITGDEVVKVIYSDGSSETFDAGSLLFAGRMLDDEDYFYRLIGDNIQEWLHFAPDENGGAISYQRARAFKGTPNFYMREGEKR